MKTYLVSRYPRDRTAIRATGPLFSRGYFLKCSHLAIAPKLPVPRMTELTRVYYNISTDSLWVMHQFYCSININTQTKLNNKLILFDLRQITLQTWTPSILVLTTLESSSSTPFV